LTCQFVPKVLVTTKGITFGGVDVDPFCHMIEQRVDPAKFDCATLTACCLPESFFFKFDQEMPTYDCNCGNCRHEDAFLRGSYQEEERIKKSNAQEEERIKKSDATHQSHDDSKIVAPKRALTVWHKDRAKKNQAQKDPGMRRKKQKPHKKNMW
jgi:hypothetical protein